MQRRKRFRLILMGMAAALLLHGCAPSVSDGSGVSSAALSGSSTPENSSPAFVWNEKADSATALGSVLALPPIQGVTAQGVLAVNVLAVFENTILYAICEEQAAGPDQVGQRVKAIEQYDVSTEKVVASFDVDARLMGLRAMKSNNGFDLLFYKQHQPNEYEATWYHWENGQPAPEKLQQAGYLLNWPPQLLHYGGTTCLAEYQQDTNQLLLKSENPTQSDVVLWENGSLVDMNLSTNGHQLLLLEQADDAVNFSIVQNGKRIAQRPLAADEKVYSFHMLEGGALLYLQDISASLWGYKLVWWPLTGDESVYAYSTQLFRGVSNQSDQVSLIEYKNSSEAFVHTFTKQGNEMEITKTALPAEFSSLPGNFFLETGKHTAHVFTRQAHAVLSFSN